MPLRKKLVVFPVIFLLTFAYTSLCQAAAKGQIKALKKEAVAHVEKLQDKMDKAALQVWEFAEIAMAEYQSSKLLADMMAEQGFTIEYPVAGLPVAFVATYGKGHPVIGILGEFDALPGLSQKAGVPKQETLTPGAPGHGCGHNLLGAASATAAIAVKEVLQKHKLQGTIKFFGCPAEETVEGKIYMARDGAFDGLDICLDWHPSDDNMAYLGTSNALNNFQVVFRGSTAHAAGDPWNGRSALDALELMNHGINYLREHVKPTVRMHYVILDGGKAPNIVPDYARAWYFVRGKDRQEVEEVYARVLKIAEGAAMMTETKHEIHLTTGVYNYLKNREIAELLYRNLKLVGAPVFTTGEQEYAKEMQRIVGEKEEGLNTKIEPFKEPEGYWGGGSTDAADVSWLVPQAGLSTVCVPKNTPGHHWCTVSSVGFSIGLKGMHTAAKVLAASAVEALLDSALVKRAQDEFKMKTKDFVYKCAIPKDQKPRVVNK